VKQSISWMPYAPSGSNRNKDRHVSAMIRYEQPLLAALLIPYIDQCLQLVYFVIKVTLQYVSSVNTGQFMG
jgi:hypothetical protein